MRAYIVDDLLARLDGEVAPIWVSIGLRVEEPGARDSWVRAMRALVDTTPRLRIRWDEDQWRDAPRSEADVEAAVVVDDPATSLAQAVAHCAGRPSRLDTQVPLRVTHTPLPDGTWAITLQLHHAIGDARSLGRVTRRLWAALTGAALEPDHTAVQPLSDARILATLATRPLKALGRLDPARFLLARRAVPMRRDADDVGAPTLRAMTFEALADPVDVFHGAFLATAASFIDASDGILRLRVPFDLSAPLGLHGAFCNTCIALPLEFDLRSVRQTHPRALASVFRRRVHDAWSSGAQWAAMLEVMVAARLVSTDALRHGARPGLVCEPRTNTAVVTYVGDLTRYLDGAPFDILDACGHTPTWGANAWTMRGRLVVNVSGFAGLWTDATHDAFAAELSDTIESHGLGVRLTHERALHA